MASYGQYNRNQANSDEAADALEQSIFDSDHLYEKYRDELSPLLQEAELRLGEMNQTKFTKIENILNQHITRWYSLNKNLIEMALNFRTHYNHINVKLDSLKVEIDERDKIIRTQRKDFENDKDTYENQLKVLESALADSIPRNKSAVLSIYDTTDESYQLQQVKADMKAQEQSYQKLQIENKRITDNMTILKSSSNDFQQTLMNLNNEMSKKEDEILKLRWLTQDLAAERNELETKIQTHTKDPNFTSVTPQRQMEYGVDFSKYIDDDAGDLSDDAAENGLLSLEMSDDADINPQVARKLAEALEAVKKVTQFANDRDNDARQLEDDKEKQQQEMAMQNLGMADEAEHKDESEDRVSNLPRHPNIKIGDSHDDMLAPSRRKSILDFSQAFEQEKKRQSIKNADSLNKLQKEDLRRSKNSRRRRSSVSNLPLGLLPPMQETDPMSKSDLGHRSKDKMNKEDITFLKSLANEVKSINVGKLKETPANSPLNSPTNNAPSPVGSEDDPFTLNINDVVNDEDVHQGLDSKDSGDKYVESLKRQIEDKATLIGDLQTNLRELSENRRRELVHFQQQLETMKSRCRDWYEQLMNRVREMEGAYSEKIEQEIVAKQQELTQTLNEERRRMREEYQSKLLMDHRDHDHDQNDGNPQEIDELSREIARLNEELEKFKGKYFDGEQQKIELADQLDEIKEEKFKMEEKLEELAAEVARYKEMMERDDGRSHNQKSTAEWNELVQKLREEKEQQEAQYEEEFREFERMANEKVVQLEEYYVQQLQMKEVHVQQLQQQLQQQLLLKQQQQSLQIQSGGDSAQVQQLSAELSGLKEKNAELTQQLTVENSKLQSELSKVQYQSSHDREQLNVFRKRSDGNEQKITAYNASFIELAEKLKQLNDDTKALRKENHKKQKKCDKLEKAKKKLKAEVRDLKEKIDNIRIVTKELVRVKQETRANSEQFENERKQYVLEVQTVKSQMMDQARKKIDSVNKYNVEMNNLRTNIKTLQKRLMRTELECDKLRETDSQSVIGSAANWVPSVFFRTKR